MFAPYRSNATAYRQLGVETAVATATPHKLIAMLFDGATEHLTRAASAMATGDISGKGEAISRVIRIIDEGLRACLDDRGGDLAANLRALYTYSLARLLKASRDNDPALLEEVRGLLDQISTAWSQIAPERTDSRTRAPGAAYAAVR
jgi:flagellar protein FliS